MGTHPPLDAVIVGAGISGIGAAVQLKKIGYDNLALLEREDDIGGTWHVNRYPGAGVDIVSSSYQYDFEPNPHWSRLYAKAGEVKQYVEFVADKYDVRRHIRTGSCVTRAEWDDRDNLWSVMTSTGETYVATFLISASGFLSQRHYPDIRGLSSFGGQVLHTTWWDPANDLTGRRVAVIGTGATAVQLVPELARAVDHLTVYQRTPIWVTPKIDGRVPAWIRSLAARFSVVARSMSWFTDVVYDLCLNSGILNYRRYWFLNRFVEFQSRLMLLLSVRSARVRRQLTPEYSIGCKRPAVSNSYYRTFDRSNVSLETSGISHIDPDGIVARDGTKSAVDTLVLATGFNVWDHNFPAFSTVGRGGADLGKWWIENKYASYQGITVPHFPNYIAMTCPWAFTGLSYFDTVAVQMTHIGRLLGEVRRTGAGTFEITEVATTRFLQRMKPRLADTILGSGNCSGANSYYFNRFGEAAWFRPTSRQNARVEHSQFPFDDYAME